MSEKEPSKPLREGYQPKPTPAPSQEVRKGYQPQATGQAEAKNPPRGGSNVQPPPAAQGNSAKRG
jgi:hypothetical protein